VVQSVIESLLLVPESAHAAVRFTTLLLLGELGEWMDKHPAVVGKALLLIDLINYYLFISPDL
jgi:hypothetical protein